MGRGVGGRKVEEQGVETCTFWTPEIADKVVTVATLSFRVVLEKEVKMLLLKIKDKVRESWLKSSIESED